MARVRPAECSGAATTRANRADRRRFRFIDKRSLGEKAVWVMAVGGKDLVILNLRPGRVKGLLDEDAARGPLFLSAAQSAPCPPRAAAPPARSPTRPPAGCSRVSPGSPASPPPPCR